MKDSLKIAVAGATGYIGLELIKMLSTHPKVKIIYLCAVKSVGKNINFFDKRIKKKNLPKISKIQKINWKNVDILFTALPNGEAQKIAKTIPQHINTYKAVAKNSVKTARHSVWSGIILYFVYFT